MTSVFPSRSDIKTAMTNHVCYSAIELHGGNVVRNGANVIFYSGGFTTVFPFIDKRGKKIAVRCWVNDIGEAQKRMQIISSHLKTLNSIYFVPFRYIENAILINSVRHPVVIMDWIEGYTLKEYLNIADRDRILLLLENFKMMVIYFHKNYIAHGDFQHGNIMVKSDGSLLVIDYDSMYVEGLKGMKDVIKGKAEYQHPARNSNEMINQHLDYYSELVIYLSILVYAEMPRICDKNIEWLVFSKEDLNSPSTSDKFIALKNSSNSLLRYLSNELMDCLRQDSISNLKPLEEILKDFRENIVADNIFTKM